jgi:hypothetical protein
MPLREKDVADRLTQLIIADIFKNGGTKKEKVQEKCANDYPA